MRPRYGGTLRISMLEAPQSLDPAKLDTSEGRYLLPLMFEGLTRFDFNAHLRPQLATRWQSDSQMQHWRFWLRAGVNFHDGTPMTAESVAESLRVVNPGWKVSPAGDEVVIETPASDPLLPAELALPRSGIVRRSANKIVGTAGFLVSDWQPGQKLALYANDDYWGGRPFVDSLIVTLGQSWQQQMIALQLGKADIVEVPPEHVGRAISDGRRVVESAPDELLALVFTRDPKSPQDLQLRQALSASIDRSSILNVLLQHQGEVADTILPNWMTGYAFLFAQHSESFAQAPAVHTATMTLSYDSSNPANQVIAERVALNARAAGVTLQTSTLATNADVRLWRIPFLSPQPEVALENVANMVGATPPQLHGTSAGELYEREKEMLQSGRIIPLAHVANAWAIAPSLNGWRTDQAGAYDLSDVWLQAGAP